MFNKSSLISVILSMVFVALPACSDESDSKKDNNSQTENQNQGNEQNQNGEQNQNQGNEQNQNQGNEQNQNQGNEQNQNTCTESCKNENTLNACNEDGTTKEVSCLYGCKVNKCLDAQDVLGTPCDMNTDSFCDKNNFVYCKEEDDGSTVWAQTQCPDAFTCAVYDEQAMCLATCEKVGDKSSVCGSSIEVETVCTNVDGQLVSVPDYSTQSACEFGCGSITKCAESAECEVGVFQESCLSSQRYIICNQNTVTDGYCDSGKTCFKSAQGLVKCGITCDPQTTGTHYCYENNGIYAYAEVSCREGVAGQYGLDIGSYVYCSAFCSDQGKTESGCDHSSGCICK